MMKSPEVSIVMPAYNAAGFIESTLDSVLNQSFHDWELLIVDDHSNDTTLKILERYERADSRIRVIALPKNMGAPAGPRNIGVKAARGRWIAFLDADDLWHPDKLQLQMLVLAKTGAQFCSTQMVDFRTGECPPLNASTHGKVQWITFLQQLIKFRTPTSSVVVDRNLMLRFPFNESHRYKAREDVDCWLHCHEILRRSVKIKAPLVGYRIVEGQISGRKWAMVKRHYHVLRNYRRESGKQFRVPSALAFTFTHFSLAVYYRLLRNGL